MNGNEVFYSLLGVEEPKWAQDAAEYALSVLDTLGEKNWQVSLTFSDDVTIRALNRDYRKIDAVTDVLSFVLGEYEPVEGGEPIYLAGDIVISLPALDRNAMDFRVTPDEELRRLIIHGMLHLAGMDHLDDDPSQPMLKLQEELLVRLGGHIIA